MTAGECWWITGASSGIGAAMAKALAESGARVILSGRDVAALEAVAKAAGNALVLPFETTDYPKLPSIVKAALSWAGRIDCLVNNAGISQRSLAIETDFAVYQRIVEVDLLAPIALTQLVLPHFVAQQKGRIVAISSVAGIAGSPLRTAYSAAKHGVFGYFDALRAETAHLGIDVHVIAPGSIQTGVSRNALTANGNRRGISDAAIDNGMPADDAARAMLAAIAAGQREIILATGVEAELASLRRSDPDAAFDLVSAFVQRGYAKTMAAEAH